MEYGSRFTPTKDDDYALKGGVWIYIDTRHQCITRMKEYDQLSLEELRWSDYQAGSGLESIMPLFGSSGEQEILDGFTLIRDSLCQKQFEASPGYDLKEDVLDGRLRSISTRHQCITAMKRYRNISFEELRWYESSVYEMARRDWPNQRALEGFAVYISRSSGNITLKLSLDSQTLITLACEENVFNIRLPEDARASAGSLALLQKVVSVDGRVVCQDENKCTEDRDRLPAVDHITPPSSKSDPVAATTLTSRQRTSNSPVFSFSSGSPSSLEIGEAELRRPFGSNSSSKQTPLWPSFTVDQACCPTETYPPNSPGTATASLTDPEPPANCVMPSVAVVSVQDSPITTNIATASLSQTVPVSTIHINPTAAPTASAFGSEQMLSDSVSSLNINPRDQIKSSSPDDPRSNLSPLDRRGSSSADNPSRSSSLDELRRSNSPAGPLVLISSETEPKPSRKNQEEAPDTKTYTGDAADAADDGDDGDVIVVGEEQIPRLMEENARW